MCGPQKPDCGCTGAERAAHELQIVGERGPELFGLTAGSKVRKPDGLVQFAITPPVVDQTSALPDRWHAVLVVEGLRTTDHRAIATGGLTWRDLPIALFALFINGIGHADAELVGSIESVTRNGNQIEAEGSWNLSIDAGRQAAQMCLDQTLRWVSIDLEILESRYVEVSLDGGAGGMNALDILFDDGPMDAPTDWYDEVTVGRIMGATMCGLPAFPQAVIAPIDIPLSIPEPMGAAPMVSEGLIAAGIPVNPPASFFQPPRFEEPTALTIEDNGHIFGHLALWGTCHTGVQNTCVTPPHSTKDYAYFLTGRIRCDDGTNYSVGHVTFDAPHAGETLSWQDAMHHYDHTGSVGADVTVGEDEFGIWVAGALRSTVSDVDIRKMRSAPLSGDWRRVGGGLELMAALCVNVPGFPIVAAGRLRDEQVSLIASGVAQRDPIAVIAHEVAQMRRALQPLLRMSVDQLAARVNPKPIVSLDDLRKRVNAS